jgi:biotin-(acetyl-CoA carboxylase) ligase
LPPPFRLVTLREACDAFAHAQAIAASAGAGTLVRVGRVDLAEFAVVLEPDEPLASIRRVVHAGSLALLDALAGLAPPRCDLGVAWPADIQADGRTVGGARLAWPEGCGEAEIPAWLVFGAVLRTTTIGDGRWPPHAMDELGFDPVDSAQLVERCARHLLVALEDWTPENFTTVARRYVRRLAHAKGGVPSLDDTGDLLISQPGQPAERRALADALRG